MGKCTKFLLCVAVVYVANSFTVGANGDVVANTNLGRIRGAALKSRLGKNFFGFRGIRYAKAPIGELRFKAPEPVTPWSDILDATDDGPMCPQPADDVNDVSEDCLRLNVYTDTLEDVKRPVIVYLHPGGYYGLSGQSKNFAGPQSIMDRDVVFVTLNYRLGSLGFISTGTAEAPGNAGLKDQVMALRWIKEHIQRFGGDPNSVTLVGYSAGAMSVTLHMISPMSRGLFHKAIVMSGAATAQWQIPAHQLHLAKRQAKILNCTDEAIASMMNCLKTKSAMDFGNSLQSMFEFPGGNPILLWYPVAESDFGQERFLTENPTTAYLEGRFMRIPVIAGITKDEFAGSAVEVLTNSTLTNEMDTKFNETAPICFLYERNSPRSQNISSELRKFYLGSESLEEQRSLTGLAQLFADSVIGFGMHRFVHLTAAFTKVYYYRFSYQGRYSHLYYPGDKPYGVVHHDDLLYFIVAPAVAPLFTPTDPEHITVERLTRMWTNFGATGCPINLSEEVLQGVTWEPFNTTTRKYLDFGSDLVMKEGLYEQRYALWDKLFG